MGKPFASMKATGGGGSTAQANNTGFDQFMQNGLQNGQFGNTTNQLLQGRIGDPTSYQQFFQNAGQGTGGVGGYPMQSFGNSPSYDPMIAGGFGGEGSFNPGGTPGGSPFGGGGPGGWLPGNGGFGLGQVDTNYQSPQFQGMNFQAPNQFQGQYNAPGQQGIQLGDPFGGPSQPNVGDIGSQLLNGYGSRAQLGSAGSANMDGEFAQGARAGILRDLNAQVGDTRARFGMGGSSNLGSAGQYAESNLRAEAAPSIATAMGQINQQERGLNLQSRRQDLENFLGSRTQDVNQLGYLLGQRGQDVTQRGQSMDQFGNMIGQNNQAILGQNQQNNQNAQFGAQFGLDANNSNNQAMQQYQNMLMNQNQFGNAFNQQNSQFGANFGQQGQQMNNQFGLQNQQQMNQFGLGNMQNMMQNQQQMNQYGLGQANVGLGMQQNQLSAQQNAMQQMFQAYMQNQQLNTAQRQQYVQPGYVQQGMGLLSQGADIFKKVTGR